MNSAERVRCRLAVHRRTRCVLSETEVEQTRNYAGALEYIENSNTSFDDNDIEKAQNYARALECIEKSEFYPSNEDIEKVAGHVSNLSIS